MALFTTLAFLVACTDYVQQIADRDGEWDHFNPNVEYGELTDSRDGLTYKTVTIGSQTWMAENLNFETDSSFCYNNEKSNCAKYGRLYTWAAAMDSAGSWTTNGRGCGFGRTCSPTYPVRGVCPEGWHLPDTTEWKTLFNAVGGDSTAGKVLMSTSGWSSGNGTDSFGFSALPAGKRERNGMGVGHYGLEGVNANFWSSTNSVPDVPYYVEESLCAFRVNLSEIYGYSMSGLLKDNGFSVRCLQD